MLFRAFTLLLLFSDVQTFVAASTLPTNLFSTFRQTQAQGNTGETVAFNTYYPKSNFTVRTATVPPSRDMHNADF